ncbi:DNA-binding transcriptional regulator, MarR family [Alkalispirochaeta americana]|uniref:DNA-binding transcriptional regulator, MarR family n=1 Tax=Alkalispirochaeta americana TaxID=159291 RepID=A0A1N6RGZ0_9SPIO|nr:MarR family transcriptional regulator [Alkalispirochaeta americana]SIQ28085.1 DNA-binding transcriptional regulator, MarR family [Alkalispirochaeta americana]
MKDNDHPSKSNTDPSLDTPTVVHLTKRLRKIARGFDKHSRYLQEHHHITVPQVICLKEVAEQDTITLSKLTKIVALTNSTVTGIVDRLEKQDLLHRVRSSSDRRQIHLCLTEKGTAFLQEIPSAVPRRFIEGMQSYTPAEVEQILWAVDQIADLLDPDSASSHGE